jgi:hypothetical protein
MGEKIAQGCVQTCAPEDDTVDQCVYYTGGYPKHTIRANVEYHFRMESLLAEDRFVICTKVEEAKTDFFSRVSHASICFREKRHGIVK